MPETLTVKEQVIQLIEKMPDDITWEDVMEQIYIREVIESGLEDVRMNRVKDVSEVRKEYGLPG